MASLDDGSVFAGYRVLAKLGEGGMGQVYLVEHPHLLRREALKVISVNAADSAEFQQRFTNEARTVATLTHPGIVAIHHYGIDGGSPWFTMAYLDGRDLTDGGLSDADIAVVASRAAEALDYAHRHNVIHRDIKPANVIVTREPNGSIDQVVVLDFGIAKLLDSTRMTATQAFIGTLAYAPPEIIDGRPASPATDQYSLACSIYELLTGDVPFAAPTPTAMMAAMLSKTAPPLSTRRPDLAALDPVFERALAKDPAQRYPDCQSLAAALAPVLANSQGSSASAMHPVAALGGPNSATTPLVGGSDLPTVESRQRRSNRGIRALLAVLSLIVVAIIAVVGSVFAFGGTDSAPPAAAGPAITKIAAGVFHTCAIRLGDAYCWGQNESGQIGDGSTTNRTAPAKVAGIKDVSDISLSGDTTCAAAEGKAYCWGDTVENNNSARDFRTQQRHRHLHQRLHHLRHRRQLLVLLGF